MGFAISTEVHGGGWIGMSTEYAGFILYNDHLGGGCKGVVI